MIYTMLTISKIPYDEGSAGALVQWLKPPVFKVGYHGFEPNCGLQVSKKQEVLLAQVNLYVHKGGQKTHLFNLISSILNELFIQN